MKLTTRIRRNQILGKKIIERRIGNMMMLFVVVSVGVGVDGIGWFVELLEVVVVVGCCWLLLVGFYACVCCFGSSDRNCELGSVPDSTIISRDGRRIGVSFVELLPSLEPRGANDSVTRGRQPKANEKALILDAHHTYRDSVKQTNRYTDACTFLAGPRAINQPRERQHQQPERQQKPRGSVVCVCLPINIVFLFVTMTRLTATAATTTVVLALAALSSSLTDAWVTVPSTSIPRSTAISSSTSALRQSAPAATEFTLDGETIRGPMKPLGNYVLVKTKDALSATDGGILLPDQVCAGRSNDDQCCCCRCRCQS